MNPFKHKLLEEFTLADCEQYISRYPYGERLSDVKRHMRNLTSEQHKQLKGKVKIQKKTKEITRRDSEVIKEINGSQNGLHITKKSSVSDYGKILTWIGLIIAVFILGTVVITILNNILPYNWWNKYRYIIFPAIYALGRWVQREFKL